MNLINDHLSDYQQRYWKDPEHYRELQRNKYNRYPERIKELNSVWANKNREYLKQLRRFNAQIFYYRKKNDMVKVQLLNKAKTEFKKMNKCDKIFIV